LLGVLGITDRRLNGQGAIVARRPAGAIELDFNGAIAYKHCPDNIFLKILLVKQSCFGLK
jgi:hypothetical protein